MTASSRRRGLVRGAARALGALHAAVYRLSGGRVGGRIKRLPILLLTTTGRKTGKSRTLPLGFVRDGESLVVVASNGGMDWSPAWWLNLKRNPSATVAIGRARHRVNAREADPGERERLWKEFTELMPAYAAYERRTTRRIPVVILTPSGGAGSGAS